MKALVVRFSAMGDLVLTTGVIAEIKRSDFDLELDLLTSEIGAEIYQSNSDINRIIIVEKSSGFFKLIKKYRQLGPYDKIIDLQGSFKSYLLRFFVKGEYHRIEKQSRERRAFVKKRKFRDQLKLHVVEKYYQTFGKAFSLPPAPIETLRPRLFSNKITFEKKNFDFSKSIVVHPYASQKNKVWPHFQEFIAQLVKKGFPVVVVGKASDHDAIDFPTEVLNLSDKTTLPEMAAIIASAKALVSTDSGPMHVGTATQTPTLALFGPTTKELGFYPEFTKTRVLEISDLECRPCHVHGGNTCPMKHFKCMKDITVESAIHALQELI